MQLSRTLYICILYGHKYILSEDSEEPAPVVVDLWAPWRGPYQAVLNTTKRTIDLVQSPTRAPTVPDDVRHTFSSGSTLTITLSQSLNNSF